MICPDENVLAELVQGLLDEATAAELELHLDRCTECRRIVSSVGRSSYVAHRAKVEPLETSSAAWRLSDDAEAEQPSGRAPALTMPRPGTIVAGKYRVERLVGYGGMGVVMAATHLSLGKLVALKLMRRGLGVAGGASGRFAREARAASLLRSEHIARVLDLDTLEDGSPYIAMEYLEGEDLGAVLARGSVPSHLAATYIVQVCDAIGEAHAAGIVHRDLKPSNLFLTHRGNTPCVKVLDFGISKIIAGGPLTDDVATTDTESLMGSPRYMAPEQLISARKVDPRTDVWALGCILFELVSGNHPFDGTALAQVVASILRDDAPALSTLCPELPAGIDEIVGRCLAKDPARRFQRVTEIADALAPFTSAPVAMAAGSPAPADRRSRLRSRWTAIAVVAAIVLAGVSYAGYRLVQDNDERGAPMIEPLPAPLPTLRPPQQPSAPRHPITVPQVAPAPAHTPSVIPQPQPARNHRSNAKRTPRPRSPRLEDDLIGPSFAK
ncbi:MAG: protein kinase [Kofleriaceae bacterium]